MLRALTLFTRLSRSDISRRKSRLVNAAVLYLAAGLCVFVAGLLGLGALAVWLSAQYGWIMTLVVLAAGFIILAAILLITNSILSARAERERQKYSATRSALLATALATATSTRSPLISVALGIAGLYAANTLMNSADDDDA